MILLSTFIFFILGYAVHARKQQIINYVQMIKNPTKLNPVVPIQNIAIGQTKVEEYWNRHTVHSIPFKNSGESFKYLDWRSNQYPLYSQLMDVWGNHEEKVVLDYGCGPGNDLIGFLAYSNIKKVIGVDVSLKALTLASHRLGLHKNDFDLSKVELIKISDQVPQIPIEDNSIDHVNCSGVLMHTSHPKELMREFHRVLKENGTMQVMVYNRDSIWRNLYVAYEIQIKKRQFSELSLDDAFTRMTDGNKCPIANSYSENQFCQLALSSGFIAEYRGGYYSTLELDLFRLSCKEAIAHPKLNVEACNFLSALKTDSYGFPRYKGHYAGIGGSYFLRTVQKK